MYSEDDQGNVTISMKASDYQVLLMAIGYAVGAASKEQEPDKGESLAYSFIRLANTINEGNPGWVPYEQ